MYLIIESFATIFIMWLAISAFKKRDRQIAEVKEQEMSILCERIDTIVEKRVEEAAAQIMHDMKALIENVSVESSNGHSKTQDGLVYYRFTKTKDDTLA